MTNTTRTPRGAQRLSIDKLQSWRDLDYGIMFHYGMSTFSPYEAPDHYKRLPIETYAPENLDVDQWIRVARDAGMKYAILVTKHGTGFALWPTKYGDYHVGNTKHPTDVVEAFVDACRRHGLTPAFYFGGEGPKGFGSPPAEAKDPSLRERAFYDYTLGQLEELLTQYGPVGEMWFDHPGVYGREGRQRLYDHVAKLQPETVIGMNGAFETNGLKLEVKPQTWPTDIVILESSVPPLGALDSSFVLEAVVTGREGEPQEYYIPCEAVSPVDRGAERWWFGGPSGKVRSDAELLSIRILCRERNANCVFNIPPTPAGRLRQDYVEALMRLSRNYDRLGLSQSGRLIVP
ncbi:MAG: alpha-L-fucosidase [Planctomycetota bacterium]|jgi:alpha-L-fucosidase